MVDDAMNILLDWISAIKVESSATIGEYLDSFDYSNMLDEMEIVLNVDLTDIRGLDLETFTVSELMEAIEVQMGDED